MPFTDIVPEFLHMCVDKFAAQSPRLRSKKADLKKQYANYKVGAENFRLLSADLINEIGRFYLEEYLSVNTGEEQQTLPENKAGHYYRSHQKLAEELVGYKDPKSATDEQKEKAAWDCLLNVFKQLEQPSGRLYLLISPLLEKAFDHQIDHHKPYNIPKTVSEIFAEFENLRSRIGLPGERQEEWLAQSKPFGGNALTSKLLQEKIKNAPFAINTVQAVGAYHLVVSAYEKGQEQYQKHRDIATRMLHYQGQEGAEVAPDEVKGFIEKCMSELVRPSGRLHSNLKKLQSAQERFIQKPYLEFNQQYADYVVGAENFKPLSADLLNKMGAFLEGRLHGILTELASNLLVSKDQKLASLQLHHDIIRGVIDALKKYEYPWHSEQQQQTECANATENQIKDVYQHYVNHSASNVSAELSAWLYLLSVLSGAFSPLVYNELLTVVKPLFKQCYGVEFNTEPDIYNSDMNYVLAVAECFHLALTRKGLLSKRQREHQKTQALLDGISTEHAFNLRLSDARTAVEKLEFVAAWYLQASATDKVKDSEHNREVAKEMLFVSERVELASKPIDDLVNEYQGQLSKRHGRLYDKLNGLRPHKAVHFATNLSSLLCGLERCASHLANDSSAEKLAVRR